MYGELGRGRYLKERLTRKGDAGLGTCQAGVCPGDEAGKVTPWFGLSPQNEEWGSLKGELGRE